MKETRDSVPTQKMVQIDWSEYTKDETYVFLAASGITEMNWNGAPPELIKVDLHCNEIKEMNWVNAPSHLIEVKLSFNEIREMNWENAPPKLKNVYLSENYIRENNWKDVPNSLTWISEFTWCTSLEEYKAARRIQRAYLRHYTRRKVAARKIIEGCHAWVWKPVCKDGTIGIRPRLDTRELGLE